MKSAKLCLVLLAIASILILAPVAVIPNWFYAVPLAALVGGMYWLFARLRRFKLFLLLLLPVLFVGLEATLRINSFHRTVKYERRGDLLFTPKPSQQAVAKMLGCSPRHVYRLSDSGQMPRPLRLGSLVRWSEKSIETWIFDGCRPVRQLKVGAR